MTDQHVLLCCPHCLRPCLADDGQCEWCSVGPWIITFEYKGSQHATRVIHGQAEAEEMTAALRADRTVYEVKLWTVANFRESSR
jgi:hypothetical protein